MSSTEVEKTLQHIAKSLVNGIVNNRTFAHVTGDGQRDQNSALSLQSCLCGFVLAGSLRPMPKFHLVALRSTKSLTENEIFTAHMCNQETSRILLGQHKNETVLGSFQELNPQKHLSKRVCLEHL